MKIVRRILLVLIVIALLGDAYRIVEKRDRALGAAAGGATSSMPMH
jgi:hypothetical protein